MNEGGSITGSFIQFPRWLKTSIFSLVILLAECMTCIVTQRPQ
jgi:hypothetical protein